MEFQGKLALVTGGGGGIGSATAAHLAARGAVAVVNDVDQARIDAVVARMRAAGMQATVSSIHVNGWFGVHTKLTGARWIVERVLGRDLDAERERWLYVGDSTNDEPMFAAFPLSVGVANIADFADRLQRWPAYVTQFDRGRGFVEIAESLLAARSVTS